MRAWTAHSRKRRRREGAPAFLHALRWLLIVVGATYLSWSLYFPGSAGALGRWLHAGAAGVLGRASLLLPPLIAYAAAWTFFSERSKGLLTLSAGSALSLLSASVVLSRMGAVLGRHEWGGALGDRLSDIGTRGLGPFGVLLAAVSAGLLGLYVLFGISWVKLLIRGGKLLVEDYRGWRRSRLEMKDLILQAAALPSDRSPEAAGMAPIPEPAKAAPPPAPREEPATEARQRPKKDGAGAPKPVPVPVPNAKPYKLPPLTLLHQSDGDASSGRPSAAEVDDAKASLQRALASFEIEAQLSEIHPGPVITRYEVRPAPGVTVNSIVARADDIALATRAKGIRMIAPIPGKDAIGIEIPNQRPATVTLREVLQSKALTDNPRPLAFALGLSSDGAPLAADLQSMPHVLIAGATNSGKSVMVHSLIGSILFRQRPEQVKLLLIDPKRIELTLYDGVPHLYDPKTRPEEVRVITHAKEAARALKALVRVMEHRYERFQQFRARDIDGFNREAARRGEPGEHFIVVVIDELADLMVVARDVVEDSIQRLTQMARAVGIHMVIATQRPSVDVITGVIKANLPSRLAMRVASKIDSKVILDMNGAEALLGKGDALYMTPGQDPWRIQGCLVTTPEIEALVSYLRTQGGPQYALLDSGTGAASTEDLSQFGVEHHEFVQALKLVAERRRVSQDLLKSQFGSSARATNMLSLLEIKGFINKPEGSNRWNIYFDKIEDYMREGGGPASKSPKEPSPKTPAQG